MAHKRRRASHQRVLKTKPAKEATSRRRRRASKPNQNAFQLPIDAIRADPRHRKGDLDGLAASMAELGLLQPVVVRPDGTLIAGERRRRDAGLLGWEMIPVTVVDLDAVVRGEFAENTHRKDFSLSEAVAIKRALPSSPSYPASKHRGVAFAACGRRRLSRRPP